jgi:hypothetical protein
MGVGFVVNFTLARLPDADLEIESDVTFVRRNVVKHLIFRLRSIAGAPLDLIRLIRDNPGGRIVYDLGSQSARYRWDSDPCDPGTS